MNIDISPGSVATYLMYGGIFKYEFVANLPASLPVKEFVKIGQHLGRLWEKFGVLFFDSQCNVASVSFRSHVNGLLISRFLARTGFYDIPALKMR